MPKNLYCDLASFSRQFATGQTLDTTDLTEIEKMSETAARRIDHYTKRHFYPLTETRYFNGNGCDTLRIPDLISATSIKLDENYDGVYEYTMVATDYWLEREFADNVDAPPFDLLRLNQYTGTRRSFLGLRRLIQIIGSWGYSATVERQAQTATMADATTTVMTTSAAGSICVGQTYLIESEQVYVAAGTASPWTVTRGMNGTTGVAHAAKPMDLYVYEPAVRDAALMTVGRMWKRKDSGYAATPDTVSVGMGGSKVDVELDGDVRMMLADLRRLEFGR